MDSFFDVADATLTYECGPIGYDDFPRTDEPVYILGEKYSAIHDLDDLKRDILSRLWFTYRKGFPQIGGTGPSSDNGWGCMLRCGQMMLAQALILRHLGRGWRWIEGSRDEKYKGILRLFLDRKRAKYSIHQIASMGVSEGKAVGQWFGPNTIAQVLKKLVVYDDWSSVVIHVAMDNTVIEDDVKCACKCSHGDDIDRCEIRGKFSQKQKSEGAEYIDCLSASSPSVIGSNGQKGEPVNTKKWKPLLLIIPLRLGLTETNSVYISGMKTCLSFRQSVGMIGGKPNHAHWFIGYVGDELVYLDPHTTQVAVDIDSRPDKDETFHCKHASRMKILDVDPSVAMGFYCGTESEFDDLCQSIQKFILHSTKNPMFELHKERPLHWPPFEPYTSKVSDNAPEFTVVESHETDEDFELVG